MPEPPVWSSAAPMRPIAACGTKRFPKLLTQSAPYSPRENSRASSRVPSRTYSRIFAGSLKTGAAPPTAR